MTNSAIRQGMVQVKILKDAWPSKSGATGMSFPLLGHVKGEVKSIEHWVGGSGQKEKFLRSRGPKHSSVRPLGHKDEHLDKGSSKDVL